VHNRHRSRTPTPTPTLTPPKPPRLPSDPQLSHIPTTRTAHLLRSPIYTPIHRDPECVSMGRKIILRGLTREDNKKSPWAVSEAKAESGSDFAVRINSSSSMFVSRVPNPEAAPPTWIPPRLSPLSPIVAPIRDRGRRCEGVN
jgi:hypothetical protein